MFSQHGTHLVTNLHPPIRGEQGGRFSCSIEPYECLFFYGGDESIIISSGVIDETPAPRPCIAAYPPVSVNPITCQFHVIFCAA